MIIQKVPLEVLRHGHNKCTYWYTKTLALWDLDFGDVKISPVIKETLASLGN